MTDILVMGSNTVDIYVSTGADLINISYPSDQDEEELLGYPLGQKLLADDLDIAVGGSGVNAATAFKRCGMNTTYLGCLGKDMFGKKVFDHLKEENITFTGSLGDQNGLGIILESQATDRTILSYKGCNNDLHEEDIPEDITADWFYTSTVMGETREAMTSLITSLEDTTTAMNVSSYLARQGIEDLQPALAATDYLFLNYEEAKDLTGYHEIPRMISTLNDALRGIPIITRGSNGVYYADGDINHMESQAETVVETTGAGDAFNAGFITAKANGYERQSAVTAGMIQAEHVIQHKSSTEALLDKDDLLNELNDDTREPKVIQ